MNNEKFTPDTDLLVTPVRAGATRYHFTVYVPEECELEEAEKIQAKFTAAPDMYEALEEITQAYWEFINAGYKNAMGTAAINKAKAALSKANPQKQTV